MKRLAWRGVATLVVAACSKNGYTLVDNNDAGIDGGGLEAGTPTAATPTAEAAVPPAEDAAAVADASAPADAAPDATPPCDLSAPFGMPNELPVSAGGSYYSASLSADETIVVLTGRNPASARSEDYDLWVATRATRADAFGAPTRVGGADSETSDEFDPSLSPDGLTLYFKRSLLLDGGGTTNAIYKMDRASAADVFRPPVAASDFANKHVYGIAQTRSGHDYLGLFDDVGDDTYDIVAYDPSDAGPMFSTATTQELNSPIWDYSPALTVDELTMYFTSNRTEMDDDPMDEDKSDIYVATRASSTGSFGAPSLVTELNSSRLDRVDWVSPDGCRIYFISDRTANVANIEYFAEKPATK